MNLAVVFRQEAEADVLETRDWYERQQYGLGDAFGDSLDQIVVRIEAMPQMYAAVFRDVRRGTLRRVPLRDLLSRPVGSNRGYHRASRESRSKALARAS